MRQFFTAAFFCMATSAMAQSEAEPVTINTNFFHPVPTGSFFGVQDPSILPKLKMQAGLYLHFADRPFLIIDDANNGAVTIVVDNQTLLDFSFAIGLSKRFEVGLALPAALSQQGESRDQLDQGAQISGGALGDLRLGAKALLYGEEEHDGVSAAASFEVALPTGNEEQLLGDSSTAATIEVLGQWKSGPLRLAATLGPKLQKRESFFFNNLTVGNSLEYAAALSYQVHPKVSASGELDGSLALVGDEAGTSPMEGRAGAKINIGHGLTLPVGVGVGIIDGVGAPRFRLFAGLSFSPQPNQDPDKDGLLGEKDKCPKEAETKNQFQDEDGCPDTLPDEDPDKDGIAGDKDRCPTEPGTLNGCPDADNDTVADLTDKCPKDPEDVDSFEDQDGCPELDNDNDGMADKDDNCPIQAGTVDTLGCPDADNDKIADLGDKCPKDPEDVDSFEDQDGCPELDNDKDTFADKDDACPDRAEDFVGDKDGCPEKKGLITIKTTNSVDFSEQRIFFDINSDVLQSRSYPTLDAVVRLLKDHPEYTKIEVGGHTDDVGNTETNQKLSERRAQRVVDYLIAQGIDKDRLEAKGYGMTRPLVKAKTRDARDKNRRVEFVIVE